MIRTKVICTIGPACRGAGLLKKMLARGMDGARFNFSHGRNEEHLEKMALLKELAAGLGRPLALVQDLAGPKIRIGSFARPPVRLKKGSEFVLTARRREGDEGGVSVNCPSLPRKVRPGDRILLDDGNISLTVLRAGGEEAVCRVLDGGLLRDRKGVNVPGVELDLPSFTGKDEADLALGLAAGVDYVALSFVRRAEDVLGLRRKMTELGGAAALVAKIETPAGVKNIRRILEVSDGIMVARGDLGVEMSPVAVPNLQKSIIREANRAGKLVITATQMLESMTANPRPTRAEASDVANAVYDGSDVLMLSAETSLGRYPVQALSMMKRIAGAAEKNILRLGGAFSVDKERSDQDADALCRAAREVAAQVRAKAVVVFTQSGYSALIVSSYRPAVPVIAFSPREETVRGMSLYWGVRGERICAAADLEGVFRILRDWLAGQKGFRPGDKIVLVLGWPLARYGITNLLHIYEV